MTILRILSAADLHAALPMPVAIDAMRVAFAALSAGRATVPLRTSMETPDGLTFLMPAYIHGASSSVIKLVSVYGGNPARRLPLIHALVLAFDAETGEPRALFDGAALTAIRTGAAGGLAADLLARNEAQIIGCIGAGVQARTQIEAALTARPTITEVRVYCRTEAVRVACCQGLAVDHPMVRFVSTTSRSAALDGADILIAATTSATPVITADDLRPGVHITGVGSYLPTMQEVESGVVQRAKVVVDQRAACQAEAGDLIIPHEAGGWNFDRIHAEIGEIVTGARPGREDHSEITFFKSVGNAVQDAAAAAQALINAEQRGLGQMIAF